MLSFHLCHIIIFCLVNIQIMYPMQICVFFLVRCEML